MGILAVLCDNGLEQASAALLMFGLLFVTWIEAMTKLLLAAVCVVALTAGAQATPPIDSFVCTEVKVSSPDGDKDPTERIEITTGII